MTPEEKRALPPFIDPTAAEAAEYVLRGLQAYHRYRVEGMSHIPKAGPVLLVVHHSLATYDIALLAYSVYKQLGRPPRALADRQIFKTPGVARFVKGIGGVQGAPDAARDLLADGHVVMVAPGGMREALRPSRDRYSISWENRLGFARLAIASQAPVVCAACPAADDLYDVYPSRLTRFCLKQFHWPVPVVRGLGPTLLPRPVRLTHHIGAPLQPPQGNDDAAVHAFHAEVAASMRALLGKRP